MIFKKSIGSLCLFKSRLLKEVFNMMREKSRIVDRESDLLTVYIKIV